MQSQSHLARLVLSFALAASAAAAVVPAPALAKPETAAKRAAGDAASLSTLAAANEHEVAMAEQAIAKGVTGGVLDFANKMKSEHGQNLVDTRALASAKHLDLADTGPVKAMKAKGKAEQDRLAKLSGAAYEQAYVDAMVKGHEEVLAKLDHVLIPQASEPAVVAHLKTTRGHVAEHLALAKSLQPGKDK